MKKYQILKNDYMDIRHPTSNFHKIVRLYRIIALRDFNNISAGTIGGYIENENNLSHEGYCWVSHTAKIFDNARVTEDAMIMEDAAVYGNASVQRGCIVSGYSHIRDKATVINSHVSGKSNIRGNATVTNSKVMNSALIYGSAYIDKSELMDGTIVHGDAKLTECVLKDVSEVRGSAVLFNSTLSGRAIIDGGHYSNESFNREIDLLIESGKGER